MLYQFEYFEFTPRKEFKTSADQMLSEIAQLLPTESICEARCTYFNRIFFFQIKLINSDIELKSQIVLDPKKEDTAKRDWQTKALKKMGDDLKNQLKNQFSKLIA